MNVKNALGLTPLHYAAINGSRPMVTVLLAKGALAGAKDHNGQTPEQWAALKGHRDVEEILRKTSNKNK